MLLLLSLLFHVQGIEKLRSLRKVAAQLKRCVNGKDPISVLEDLSEPVLTDIGAHDSNSDTLAGEVVGGVELGAKSSEVVPLSFHRPT
jgi:hypothetical protein